MGSVYIKHPDVQALGGPVPEQAFARLWEPKGWTIAPEAEVAEHQLRQAIGNSDDKTHTATFGGETLVIEEPALDAMTKDQLLAEASRRGVDTSNLTTKADLLSALQS